MGAWFSERKLKVHNAVIRMYRDTAWAEFYWEAKRGEQKKLDDWLGVGKYTVTHWIKGRKTPSFKDGLKLMAHLQHHWKKTEKRSFTS
jgi:hypothetical protein